MSQFPAPSKIIRFREDIVISTLSPEQVSYVLSKQAGGPL